MRPVKALSCVFLSRNILPAAASRQISACSRMVASIIRSGSMSHLTASGFPNFPAGFFIGL